MSEQDTRPEERIPPPSLPTPVPDPERETWLATGLLGFSWVLLFLAMVRHQGTLHVNAADWLAGGINPRTADLFGSITSAQFLRGEVWRAVTATFVHFSVLHLVVNLVVLYQLGRLVEPWYGSAQFFAVSLVIGSLANAAASFVRPWLGMSIHTLSGGGSGILCGLIALVAVVGWRSKDKRGQDMLLLMAFQLVFLGFMGMVSQQVKNLVHAAGALVGVLAGFRDASMMARAKRFSRYVIGGLAVVVLCASAAALVVGNRGTRDEREAILASAKAVAAQQELLARAEGWYLRVVSLPSRAGSEWVERDLPGRSTLIGLVRRVLDLNSRTGMMAPEADRREWAQLVQEPLRRRPDPGSIARFRSLTQRFLGRGVLMLDQLRRKVL